MRNIIWLLIGLSALGFAIAVAISLLGIPIGNVKPEGFSNACTNLALLAIALQLASGAKNARE